MDKLVYFENDYCISGNDIPKDEGAKLREIYIDGYPSDPNAEGSVVAKVIMTEHKDVIVDWIHNAYRMNEQVLNLIEESKIMIQENW